MDREEEPASAWSRKMASGVAGGPEGQRVMGTEEGKWLQGGMVPRVRGARRLKDDKATPLAQCWT